MAAFKLLKVSFELFQSYSEILILFAPVPYKFYIAVN